MVAEMLSARCQDTSYGEKILSSQRRGALYLRISGRIYALKKFNLSSVSIGRWQRGSQTLPKG
jgi:hypothetical protein